MTIMNANTLNDQVDYLSPKGQSFAEQTLNSIFNEAPRNVVDDDDDDDLDDTLPDPDDDDLIDDDDDTFPDELDTVGDDDVIDDDDLDDDDDDTGSTTAGLNNPPTRGVGAQGRTTGRMTDHEPGSINNNDL
jgi:hypothetical protein